MSALLFFLVGLIFFQVAKRTLDQIEIGEASDNLSEDTHGRGLDNDSEDT